MCKNFPLFSYLVNFQFGSMFDLNFGSTQQTEKNSDRVRAKLRLLDCYLSQQSLYTEVDRLLVYKTWDRLKQKDLRDIEKDVLVE